MMIWLSLYLAGIALVLALFIQLRRMKLEEDGPDDWTCPWWVYVAIFVVAAAWPVWLLAALVTI